MDFGIRVRAGYRNCQGAVVDTIILFPCHCCLDFRHRCHHGSRIWHLETSQFNRVLCLVESTEQHRVFIHLILKPEMSKFHIAGSCRMVRKKLFMEEL